MRRTQRIGLVIFILLALVLAGPVSLADQGAQRFEVHFLDVGQADCAVILSDGRVMMIDGGEAAGSGLVVTYLRDVLHVSHIDVMVSTHPHDDHAGGLCAVLGEFTVGGVFSPVTEYASEVFDAFLRQVGMRGRSLRVPEAGDSFSLGSAWVQFLTPLRADYPLENDRSLVLRVTYGATSFLFMADAEQGAEEDIVRAGLEKRYELRSDVIKAGHHGWGTSTTPGLLEAVRPKYAVISVGEKNNSYLPFLDVLARLSAVQARIFRTDIMGNVVCFSDGERISFRIEKKDPNLF